MTEPGANGSTPTGGQNRYNPLDTHDNGTKAHSHTTRAGDDQHSQHSAGSNEEVTVNVLYAMNQDSDYRENPAKSSSSATELSKLSGAPTSRTRRKQDHNNKEDNDKKVSSSTRHKVGEILDSHPVQLCILVLLIVDVCAIVTETTVLNICHHELHSLFYLSIAILSLFLLQQVLLMVCFDKEFFKRPLYVLDVIVVLTALILELTIEEPEGGLLIVLMLWRAVRVVHGVAVSVETGHGSNPELKKELGELHVRRATMGGYTYILSRLLQMKHAAREIQHAYRKHALRLKQKQKGSSSQKSALDGEIIALRRRINNSSRTLLIQHSDTPLEDDENIKRKDKGTKR